MTFNLPHLEIIKKKIEKYFLKKKNENDVEICSNSFNYYYTSDEELRLFGNFENKKKVIKFEQFTFNIKYNFDDQWDIIMN